MELVQAEMIAKEQMIKHKLYSWDFKFNKAKTIFGYCNYSKKTIFLSEILVKLNNEEQVNQTILHEIAHALLGRGNGHNKKWKRKAKDIGYTGKRCYDTSKVAMQKKEYMLVCGSCGYRVYRYRKTNKRWACERCCKKYNSGKYTEKYILKCKKINEGV